MTQTLCCVFIALMTVADRIVKKAVMASPLAGGDTMTLIPGFLQLRYVENTGAAFGIFGGHTAALSVVTAVIILFGLGLIFSKRVKSKALLASVCLLAGGGLGNLIDRVFQGYVVDYIEITAFDFAVFNLADCFVTVGAAVLFIYTVYTGFFQKDGEKKKDE